MKERPIIFSTPMVRAILEGRKTQTRRVIKLKPHSTGHEGHAPFYDKYTARWVFTAGWGLAVEQRHIKCPYGWIGDRLWVRETWTDLWVSDWDVGDIVYKASCPEGVSIARWKPSIHMPRWASRILLELTDVRVERLQEIRHTDIWAEGIGDCTDPEYGRTPYHYGRDKANFEHLWDSLNAKRGLGWGSNPWVWALTFKRLEP